MSELLLAKEDVPAEVRALAEKVIEVQRREIHDLEHMLEG